MSFVSSKMFKLIFFAFCASGFIGTANAEKVKFHFTKNARQMHAETKTNLKSGEPRELSRYFYVDKIEKSEGLALVEERGIDTDDQTDGSGTHSGVAADILQSGEELYQKFSGTHKTTTKADGSWEANYEGESIIQGGTGKYKNARGKIRYKGRITSNSFFEEDVGEVEY
jgi:hypothetical protein